MFLGVSMPIPVIGLHNEKKVFVDGSCVLNDKRFMLIGSFVAFFIPLVIMVVTYCLTIQVDTSIPVLFWCCYFSLFFYTHTATCFFFFFFFFIHFLSSSTAGAPEAGHCLPLRGKDFLPAAFAHTSNDKYIAASTQHLSRSSDHTCPSRLRR